MPDAAHQRSDDANSMRIDDFAQAVGLSVRHLRSLNERGLLPPPEVRSRIGYYGAEHVERIRLITSLQAEGIKLEGIKRLLERTSTSSAALRRVRRAAATLSQETSEIITADELTARFDVPEQDAAAARESALRLGLLIALPDGSFEIPSPTLIDAAEAVVRSGMSLPTALRVIEEVSGHTHAIAAIFVRAFVQDVWSPFAAAGMPPDGWPLFAEAIEQTRPVAAQVTNAAFRLTFEEEIERTLNEISQNLSKNDD